MVKALCLGGVGRICRESVLDLALFSDFEQITVADVNEPEGQTVVAACEDPRVDFLRVDVADPSATVAAMRGFDIVLDGTTIALNGRTTALIAGRLRPETVFAQLARRDIHVHHEVVDVATEPTPA